MIDLINGSFIFISPFIQLFSNNYFNRFFFIYLFLKYPPLINPSLKHRKYNFKHKQKKNQTDCFQNETSSQKFWLEYKKFRNENAIYHKYTRVCWSYYLSNYLWISHYICISHLKSPWISIFVLNYIKKLILF